MIFKKIWSLNRVQRALHSIPGNMQFIKKVEYLRGLYQYPASMLGRNLDINQTHNVQTDVLVFAAHADDEVLGLSATLSRHSRNGDNIKIVFVTNGSADWTGVQSWQIKASEARSKSETRYKEAAEALSYLNIPKKNIFCLGYPDGGSLRYLKDIKKDVLQLIRQWNPGRVYVHCIEGGHIDHDMTSYVVKSVCKEADFRNVIEWAEYNSEQPIGTRNIKFLSTQYSTYKETTINITEAERNLKRKMLACHKSQNVEGYYLQGEAVRQAALSNLDIELKEFCHLPNNILFSIIKDFRQMQAGEFKADHVPDKNDFKESSVK